MTRWRVSKYVRCGLFGRARLLLILSSVPNDAVEGTLVLLKAQAYFFTAQVCLGSRDAVITEIIDY